MSTATAVTVSPLPNVPRPDGFKPTHHVGGSDNSPPTKFQNPWPSAAGRSSSLVGAIRTRFFNSKNKNHVPAPADRKGLPVIRKPDWGLSDPANDQSMKVTWIGHASFLVEMPVSTASTDKEGSGGRGVRILLDPVFSSNMSPFSFGGPKRISQPPCSLEELPEVDLVLISHDHYDHLDVTTIKFINERGNGRVKYMCGLGVGKHLVSMDVKQEDVIEMDWWNGVTVNVAGVGEVKAVCTPSQHFSGRWWNDHGNGLWCSWVILDGSEQGKKLYFAGDTGYRYKPEGTKPEDYEKLSACPAFTQIGEQYGPFDLALLPIGCYAPRDFMSHIHCAPEDSICIHRDVKSKRSIGMHYGTVRGNISEFYEDSTEPARLWEQECEKAGLTWNKEIGLCDIGGTVIA